MAWQTALPTPVNNDGRHHGTVEIGPFAKIPCKFFGSGTAASVGPSTAFVFFALCDHANRNNCNTFTVSDRALASDTGLGTRTIRDSRNTLVERGLVSCSRENGQSYQYTLPVFSFKWVPLDERPRKKRKPRALYAVKTVLP
jgi:hypothetical protein